MMMDSEEEEEQKRIAEDKETSRTTGQGPAGDNVDYDTALVPESDVFPSRLVPYVPLQEMEDDFENSKMLMEKIKNIYEQYTKIPKREMNKILKHDLWWEAEKCLQYGFGLCL